MDFSSLNYLAIIIASLASFGVGALWYSPILFGNQWQKEVGLSDDDIKNANMGQIFGGAFVLIFIAVFFLAALISTEVEQGAVVGLINGLIVGTAFVATGMGVNYLFARRSMKLFLIDAGYMIVVFGLAGLIVGLW